MSGGLKSSVINGFGSAHVRCRWNRRSDRDDGDGFGYTLRKPVDSIRKPALTCNPDGEKEERTTEKYMAPRRRRERNWLRLETVGETGSGSEFLEESRWQPMAQKGRR